jgi:two-component system copper resistance phosphate regulon response regulator CusR
MSQKRAAIISKNNLISRLIENELSLLGFETDIFDSCGGRLDGYLAIICDCTTETASPVADAKIKLAVTKDISTLNDAFTHHLPFPFSIQKLRSIILGASYEETPEEPTQKALLFDKKALTVTLFETPIKLTKYEFDILELLFLNSGKCVLRKTLTDLLGATDGNIADVYICHLRKKLEEPFGIKIIHSIRGQGYMTNYIAK